MPASALIDQWGAPLVAVEKAPVPPVTFDLGSGGGGWFPIVREPFAGAWQRNLEHSAETVLSNVAVFRCTSLIAGDIAKLRPKLVQETTPGIWEETESPAFSPVLAKPNHYQTRIQFFENWMTSKLVNGNTYVLKERDGRGTGPYQGSVRALHILDTNRVKPLITDNGDVYYQLNSDNLADVAEQTIVPASEIIHDRWNCFFHSLVGLSPIFANWLAATQGIRIQQHSTRFFANNANPGGFITAPGNIPDAVAERITASFEENFSGHKVGRIAVLGNALSYQPLGVTALNSQLIEQLRWTAEMVAASFGVPGYKVGIGVPPATTNVEALGQQYYTDCLQFHLECLELCLDEGLGLPSYYGIELDIESLLRMDSEAKMRMVREGVGAGVYKPDDGRKLFNLGPVPGGDTPYLQEQNFSLTALAKRDAEPNPWAPGTAAAPPPPPANDQGGADAAAGQSRALADLILRRARVA